MYKLMFDENQEESILKNVSEKRIWEHVEFFNTLTRISGTSDDFKAVDYIERYLKSKGVSVEVHEFMSLISHPISAKLEYISDDGEVKRFPCKTRAFSTSTPEGGLIGELIYAGTSIHDSGVTGELVDNTAAGDEFIGLDVKGKIILSERGGPENIMLAQKHGAIGFIHLWTSSEEAIHEMIATPVWGTPVPETAHLIPNLPMVSVNNKDGAYLKELCQKGKIRVRIETETSTKWRKLKLPVATIRGTEEPERFVLIGSHLDSWHVGITDNATGNASCMEMAEIFNENKGKLKRSVKIAWWPGHSYGRYAGSTWYSDNFWMDINRNCLGYINIDSPGCKGAIDYSVITGMAETTELIQSVVSKIVAQTPKVERPARWGDQSFWNTGAPSLYLLMANLPSEDRADVGGSGGGWWWHTEYDTIDKADSGVLYQDTLIYALSALRLMNSPIIPLRLTDIAKEIVNLLDRYTDRGQEYFDLGIVNQLAAEFNKLAQRFDSNIDKKIADKDFGNAKEINQTILNVLRNLNPVSFTTGGMFSQDYAIPKPAMPGLYDMMNIKEIKKDEDAYRFTLTKLVRERNRLAHALDNSIKELSN